jgi:hypothetical protein
MCVTSAANASIATIDMQMRSRGGLPASGGTINLRPICISAFARVFDARGCSMRLIAAAVMVLLLSGGAYAQGGINLLDNEKPVDPERVEKQREIDRAYQEKVKRQPAAQTPAAANDPWGAVRSSETTQGKGQKNR